MKTIVIGYDGTQSAEQALSRASELAQTFGSTVVVANVWSPVPLDAGPGAFGLVPYPAVGVGLAATTGQPDEELRRRHRDRVDSYLGDAGVPHEFADLVGDPVDEIVETAERHGADLIVVGTRDPGFLERLFGGSVSQGVVRRATCDVLVVRPPEQE